MTRARKPAAPVAAPAVRKTRRTPDGPSTGRRGVAARSGLGLLDVERDHPLLPTLRQPTRSLSVRRHTYERLLSHHLADTEPLIGRIVRASGELYVGAGPVPVSRFPELDDLWCSLSGGFDNTGRRDFGGWLRCDGHHSHVLDGEFFVRMRDRFDSPEQDVLEVPVEWEIHGSHYCPLDWTRTDGQKWTTGIATVRSKPVRYKFWAEDPLEATVGQRLLDLDRSEIYHVADPKLGLLRGRPMLAPALLRAIKMTTLEDSELRRKQVASLMSVFAVRPVDSSDDESMLPTEDEVDDMLDAVALSPGGVFQLPYGFDLKTFEPKDEPANFERALRWQLMMICMSVGLPVNEVTNDDGVERWGRLTAQRVQRQANLMHDLYEHQMLNRMRADFIDAAMVAGLWSPPADMKRWELYACEWRWPVIPAARLDQELKVLMDAVDRAHLPHSHVSRTLFGMEPETVARVGARDQARLQTLGFTAGAAVWSPDTEVAARIQAQVDAEEAAERDLVDQAALEDAVLDSNET